MRRGLIRTDVTSVCAVFWGLFVASNAGTHYSKYVCDAYNPYRMVCGEHRLYVDEEDQVMVHELIHKEEDTIVDESGDKPCYDMNNNTQWPGNSWLSEDSCNICTCTGNKYFGAQGQSY